MLNQINCAVYYGGGTSISADTPIFKPEFEYQETSMQVPCGFGSILSQLRDGLICAFEALVYLDLNRMSTWLNGETRWISASKLARVYNMSLRWVREVLYVRLEKWAKRFKIGRKGSRYHLVHHDCPPDEVPTDRFSDPKKFAVALGEGGPFDRLYKGDISWRACLIWIVLFYDSQWDPKKDTCGETIPMSLDTLSKKVRIRKQTVSEAIKELTRAGMLKRLAPRWEAGVYQLYPKPRPKGHVEQAKEKRERSLGSPGMSASTPVRDETFWYSYNGLVKCSIEGLQFEIRRKGTSVWKVSDRDAVLRMKGGPSIVRDLEKWCLDSNEIKKQRFGSSHNAGDSSHNVGDSSRSAGD